MSAVTLAQTKAHLNITVSTHDAELQSMIDGAEAAIAQKCGPLSSTATTERVRGGGNGLVVRVTPIVSLTSVTPVGGTAYTLTDLDVDTTAGVITRASFGPFVTGRYDVVYQAGRATTPDDLLLAVKELVRHLWDTQRGPTRRPGSTASDTTANTIPGAAYLFPHRVEQLMIPHMQVAI